MVQVLIKSGTVIETKIQKPLQMICSGFFVILKIQMITYQTNRTFISVLKH